MRSTRRVCQQPCLASVLLIAAACLQIEYSKAFQSPRVPRRVHTFLPSSNFLHPNLNLNPNNPHHRSPFSPTTTRNALRAPPTQLRAGVSLDDLEKEVLASAQAKLDMKRVKNAFFKTGQLDEKDNENDFDINGTILKESALVESSSSRSSSSSSFTTTKGRRTVPSKWGIAFSAGVFFATGSFLILHSISLSAFAFLVAVYTASRDPITEVGLVEGDDISGPMTRIVGRATYQSLESAKPTFQAVTRAVVDGDVVVVKLEQQVLELKRENESLKSWKKTREAVDEQMGGYTVGELKAIARENGLVVGGTKAQLMMRLVEAGSLELDEK